MKAVAWARENLFDGWGNSALTLIAIAALAAVLAPLAEWAFVAAQWGGTAEDCRAAEGACWAVIGEKYRWVLFGRYPPDQHWRPIAAMVLLMGAIAWSLDRRRWRRSLFALWAAIVAAFYWLLQGGALGLDFVPVERWGGLPLTLMLSVVGIAAAFPLAIVLALGRRSRLPAVRALCVAYIELIRGVPLISLLFMATLMLPLFLPEGVNLNDLICAQIAMILFSAAYFAEVVRGGLQAIPRGQYEAAGRAGPVLRAIHAQDRVAAGPRPRHPAACQHLHRHLQGHFAGGADRAVRPSRRGQGGVGGSGVARLSRRSLSLRCGDLFRVLLRHVAL